MSTTQNHLSLADIVDDILILKDGGGALVLQVSAVNFGLLSDREQFAIISSFAQMLNSLSFAIQIVIISERLNITSYIRLLEKAQKAQVNTLLSRMITDYKQFIQSTIKDMEVLDKKFYIVIPLFNLELGLTASRQNLEQKIKTVLLPRRDQVIRQLNRVGLRASQLTAQKLVEVFYQIYNGEFVEKLAEQPVNPVDLAVKLKNPLTLEKPNLPPPPNPPQPLATTQSAKTHPFVVEELQE